jgi:hypothetical protein
MPPKSNQEPYQTGEPIAFLRIELKHGELHLLPYSSLICVHLAPESGSDKHDQLELTFASHDVLVTGFNLKEIAEAIQKAACHFLAETNAAKAAFEGEKPGITSITVTPAGAKKSKA